MKWGAKLRQSGYLGFFFMSGCALLMPSDAIRDTNPAQVEEAPVVPAVKLENAGLSPERSVAEWLSQRQAICAGLDKVAESVPSKQQFTQTVEDRLNLLMITTCRPASTPGLLSEVLHGLTKLGPWPEEYLALFDLLNSGQKAYASVEKLYHDLKTEHEKTIQGLSEIENDIESQNAPVTNEGILQ